MIGYMAVVREKKRYGATDEEIFDWKLEMKRQRAEDII